MKSISLPFRLSIVVLWMFTNSLPVIAQDVVQEPLIIVGVKEAPPFAMRRADGGWEGVSIDLWRMLADELNSSYELRELSLEDLLQQVSVGKVDAGVAALTITPSREAQMDFSYPFYITGFGVALNHEASLPWWGVVKRFASWEFLQIVLALAALLMVAGLLAWGLERRQNDMFSGNTLNGIGNGFWWAAVSMTTVGYGDKAPITFWGRIVALVWIFASVILLSSFTAAITSALTVGQLESLVNGPGDLKQLSVGAVNASSGAEYLERQRVRYRDFPDLQAALEAVAAGRITALVHDAPLLRYRVNKDFSDRVRLLSQSFSRQDYGIALPSDSPLREPINRALLDFVGSSAWQDLLYQYMDQHADEGQFSG